MPCSPEPTLPPPLFDFPHSSLVHTWDILHGHLRDSYSLRLWYPQPPDSSEMYAAWVAWLKHLDAWTWFDARAMLLDVPRFEVSRTSKGLALHGLFEITSQSLTGP
jgi:hypothetical protein